LLTTDACQDIHPHNILLSQADRRDFAEQAPEKEFRLSCAVEYAFIDLGSACMFKPGAPPVAQAITVPPKSVRAPEQTEDCDEPINLFAADVYNLGKTLELELSAAIQVLFFIPCCSSVSILTGVRSTTVGTAWLNKTWKRIGIFCLQ
jgi:serine/threonine protein kinase